MPEAIGIFDIFKIGIGPSSSHTLGPWHAATAFIKLLEGQTFDRIKLRLFGSLAKTGKGHATDVALLLGLAGFDPATMPTEDIPSHVERMKASGQIQLPSQTLAFSMAEDMIFDRLEARPHPNTIEFSAYHEGALIRSETYLSLGGGFVQRKGERQPKKRVRLPYPIQKASDLLAYVCDSEKTIAEIVLENEMAFRSHEQTLRKLDAILDTMIACVFKGCHTAGILPGGLGVKRRARDIARTLLGEQPYDSEEAWLQAIRDSQPDFKKINQWVSCFALAVNEENAALGRVVTGPTNGAAGVIPAVLLYYYLFCTQDRDRAPLYTFLATAAEMGSLFKKGATISAAVGGCQAEIGVSSAMAAAGLTALQGGSPKQVLMAAEIAMEHHLGLTCDPVGGLVQIPCIERNALGAAKAITAANLANCSEPDESKVTLDTVIRTMWDTARGMNKKYKETAEGGLAYNLPVIIPEC